jgi:hypothetical protein
VAYADIFTALSEDRPYRKGMPSEQIIRILQDEYVFKHGEAVFEVILYNLEELDAICKKSVAEGIARFQLYQQLAQKQEAFIRHNQPVTTPTAERPEAAAAKTGAPV